MRMHLIDAITARHLAKDPDFAESSRADRRQRRRTPVRWSLALLRNSGSPAIETVTDNLSSAGFYCLSPAPLTPGETLHCVLRVPAYDPGDQERHISLECAAVEVRAEAAPDGYFGVACRIVEYQLLVNGARAG
jgi:hypothetical protein